MGAWFVRYVPIELLDPAVVILDPKKKSWYTQLLEDIKEKGLGSPLMVNNHKDRPYLIQAGNHRYICCKDLGWTHIPCIVGLNPYPGDTSTPLANCQEIQPYLGDGTVGWRPEGRFRLTGASLEHGNYPDTKMRYFNDYALAEDDRPGGSG